MFVTNDIISRGKLERKPHCTQRTQRYLWQQLSPCPHWLSAVIHSFFHSSGKSPLFIHRLSPNSQKLSTTPVKIRVLLKSIPLQKIYATFSSHTIFHKIFSEITFQWNPCPHCPQRHIALQTHPKTRTIRLAAFSRNPSDSKITTFQRTPCPHCP